jgi:hypothetical protein
MSDLQQFARVTATYRPRRTDDLKTDTQRWIGYRGVWQAYWLIEDGPYAGEWAMLPDRPDVSPVPLDGYWVPSGDLAGTEAA